MITGILQRLTELPDRTLGALTLYGTEGSPVLQLATLELPWVDRNTDGLGDTSVSRIPPGRYNVSPWDSARFPGTYHVERVPGRQAILLHTGNYPHHTRGCVLLGLSLADLDRDGRKDVASSRDALRALTRIVGRRYSWSLTVHDARAVAEDPEVPGNAYRKIAALDRRPPSPSPP